MIISNKERQPKGWKVEIMITMKMEDNIRILKLDGCTTSEAVKALEKGAIIYDDFEQNLENYLTEWGLDESEKEEYRQMAKSGVPVEDWGIVENDKKYYIQYVN